jgi:hypothetical protein
VRVDETGHKESVPEIDVLARGRVLGRADVGNSLALHGNDAVRDRRRGDRDDPSRAVADHRRAVTRGRSDRCGNRARMDRTDRRLGCRVSE